MTSVRLLKKRHFIAKNLIHTARYKHNNLVTSTPTKKQMIQHLQLDDWPSPIERTPSSSPCSTDLQSLAKPQQENNPSRLIGKQQERSGQFDIEKTGSIDKISLVNNFLEGNDMGENLPADAKKKAGEIIKKKKQWIIVNSEDEEEIPRHRDEPAIEKNVASSGDRENLESLEKPRKVDAVTRSTADVEGKKRKNLKLITGNSSAEINRDSQKYIQNLKKIASKTPKVGQKRKLSDDSGGSVVYMASDKVKKKKNRTNENTNIRKSTRNKFKPLEFWNGEKINVVSDLNSEFGNHTSLKYRKKKKPNDLYDTELEVRRMDVVGNIFESVQSATGFRRSRRILTAKTDDKKVEQKKTHSKLTKARNTKSRVRFSLAGSENAINNGPENNENLMPVRQTDLSELKTLAWEQLSTNGYSATIPQLNNCMGIVSSAVIVIKTKSFLENRALDQHDLIFCVMAGTVEVAIIFEGSKTNEKMTTFRHFVVPRGASYSIENIDGRRRAILSRFEIPCRTKYRE